MNYECMGARSTASVCTVLAANDTVLLLTTLSAVSRLLRRDKGLAGLLTYTSRKA